VELCRSCRRWRRATGEGYRSGSKRQAGEWAINTEGRANEWRGMARERRGE
jgi:hypothetical protein